MELIFLYQTEKQYSNATSIIHANWRVLTAMGK